MGRTTGGFSSRSAWAENSGGDTIEEVVTWWSGQQRIGRYKIRWNDQAPNNGAPNSFVFARMEAENVYFAGRPLTLGAETNVWVDRLGSVRRSGRDYFPYGQEAPSTTTGGKEKYGTYRHDGETDLSYADQRYYATGAGRFMTADPFVAQGVTINPTDWNRYGYVAGGDPIGFRDPTGLNMAPDAGDKGESSASGGGNGPNGACVLVSAFAPGSTWLCAAVIAASTITSLPSEGGDCAGSAVYEQMGANIRDAVAVVMGEFSYPNIGQTAYIAGDTPGRPTGQKITSETVVVEGALMTVVLSNRAETRGTSLSTEATRPGAFVGFGSGSRLIADALKSREGSLLCSRFETAIRGVNLGLQLLAAGFNFGGREYWKSVVQGGGRFHVWNPGDVVVAGTAFGSE